MFSYLGRQRLLYLHRVCACGAPSRLSAQTLSVLAALCADPSLWRHGYSIARDTGLKSGTLYPILIRLADRDLVEACWEDGQPAGRPRRHLYRLTPGGLATARAALAQTPPPAGQAGAGSQYGGIMGALSRVMGAVLRRSAVFCCQRTAVSGRRRWRPRRPRFRPARSAWRGWREVCGWRPGRPGWPGGPAGRWRSARRPRARRGAGGAAPRPIRSSWSTGST
jgi:PadR family transcriptional regulator, regulatory protein PadR